MQTQHFQSPVPGVMTDPEWIALESIGERTRRFIFNDSMLLNLRDRGLVEPEGARWRVTEKGERKLQARSACR